MSTDHSGHNHAHPVTYNNAFLFATLINGLFTVLQITFAYLSNSTSLLADGIHNLGDVLGLVMAWVAAKLMQIKPTEKASYGLKKVSILAALANGILLAFTCGMIATEAVYQLLSPKNIEALWVIVVAGIGVIINGGSALLFIRGSEDLNVRGAYLHLLYDALVSVGVVISGTLLYFTGWLWIDPLMGLLIVLVIIKGTWSLFKDSFRLIIDAVPKNISWMEVNNFLLAKQGVKGVHDLHIWAMSTKENAMSVHLYMPEDILTDESRHALIMQLDKQFGIKHVTIQIDRTEIYCEDMCS